MEGPKEPQKGPFGASNTAGAGKTLKGPESAYNAAEMTRSVNLWVSAKFVPSKVGKNWAGRGALRVAQAPRRPLYVSNGGVIGR